ncbi:hypothetical protein GGX14DRAFT_406713 [Mycena pura]|uniref:Uncharacterized protein n=1 Tax=Mycena pura TaxID=153505 RepID=A0AAD6XZH1_9AGAR|nr:hypothetical protein GGX14DRAFT_406713 [Mycena pura]
MATILPLSAADVRSLPVATFGDPARQRGGEGAKPKKRPKSGAGAGDGQEDGNGKQKKVSWIWGIRAFLTWHSKWWMERAQCVWQADEVPVTREGLQAYARQANSRPSFAPASDGGQGSVIAASSSSSRETPVGDVASGVDNESALVVDGVVERSSQVGNDYVILMLTEHDDLKVSIQNSVLSAGVQRMRANVPAALEQRAKGPPAEPMRGSSTPRTRARARTVPGCSACARTCEQRAKGAQGPAEPMRGCVAGVGAYWTTAINIYKCVAGVARKGLVFTDHGHQHINISQVRRAPMLGRGRKWCRVQRMRANMRAACKGASGGNAWCVASVYGPRPSTYKYVADANGAGVQRRMCGGEQKCKQAANGAGAPRGQQKAMQLCSGCGCKCAARKLLIFTDHGHQQTNTNQDIPKIVQRSDPTWIISCVLIVADDGEHLFDVDAGVWRARVQMEEGCHAQRTLPWALHGVGSRLVFVLIVADDGEHLFDVVTLMGLWEQIYTSS